MKSFELAKKVLELAQRLLKSEDYNQQCLLALELAIYHSGKKQTKLAQESYQKALSLSFNQGEQWSRVYPLQCYANWLYDQGQYSEALGQYKQLEDLLEETEFRSMQAYNFYYLAMTTLQVNSQKKQQAKSYFEMAKNIATELGIVFCEDLEGNASY